MAKNNKSIINENVDTKSVIMTDEFKFCKDLSKQFNKHFVINHSRKEYVRGAVHTNNIDGHLS